MRQIYIELREIEKCRFETSHPSLDVRKSFDI